MTRNEAMRQTHQIDTLQGLGFTRTEAEALRRISLTLRRWAEHECNGAIQRDGDTGDGKPFWHSTFDGRKIAPAPDRERGALRRLEALIKSVNVARAGKVPPLTSYVQGDPRGCALYIIRPGDVPDGADVGSYYTRGIAVY